MFKKSVVQSSVLGVQTAPPYRKTIGKRCGAKPPTFLDWFPGRRGPQPEPSRIKRGVWAAADPPGKKAGLGTPDIPNSLVVTGLNKVLIYLFLNLKNVFKGFIRFK